MRYVSKSVPAHWSKDFTEHLRTVHFTLISVATGLILIASSTKQYNPVVASREMHQIVELKNLWKPEWIASKGTRKFIPFFEKASSGPNTGPEDLSRIGVKEGEVFVGNLPAERFDGAYFASKWVWDIPLATAGKTLLYGSHDKAFVELSIDKDWDHQRTTPDWSPETFPTTLAEFRQWWDVMEAHHYNAVFPTAVLPEEVPITSGKNSGIPSQNSKKKKPKKIAWVISEERVKHPTEQRVLNLIIANDKMYYVASTSLGPLRLNVQTFIYTEVTQQMIAAHFGNWTVLKEPKRDSFTSSFPDLAQAAHEFETLDLEKIEKIVSDEAAKGSDVFEAFGMKFPADQITVWGIVILLAVQTYFCLYLKQLYGQYPSEEARDVPWIGMDPSFPARALFIGSIVFLPACALGTLIWRTLSQTAHPLHPGFSTDTKFSALAFVLLISLMLSIYSWKYLPQVRYPVREKPSTSEETNPSDEWPA